MSVKAIIYSFTDNGRSTAGIIAAQNYDKFRDEKIEFHIENECNICNEIFKNYELIIFVSAVGIAVRKIAPFIDSKLTDPAVLVIDELHRFVIPILSGHIGGANDFADTIAREINAIPVITTATDINGYKAIDTIAADNGMVINNSKSIKKINAKILSNDEISILHDEKVDVIISSDLEDEKRAELHIYNKRIVVGVGCRKDTDEDVFESTLNDVLSEYKLTPLDILKIASIDLKKDEKAIINYAKKYKTKFVSFSASELNEVEGEFDESEFVKGVTGVSNVSERAAVLASGKGEFLLKRIAKNGVTISLFEVKKTIVI